MCYTFDEYAAVGESCGFAKRHKAGDCKLKEYFIFARPCEKRTRKEEKRNVPLSHSDQKLDIGRARLVFIHHMNRWSLWQNGYRGSVVR